eukprot:TRINITY_DN27903_c0_g1_i1.p1 TRINITY_DN27903_c0_g1~~TRINITY_DN27903_c0_g1_i1.p1  ORF type:complete len:669 (+),score=106.63 TRINITY_DN27903_c0_g1_i1:2-2008(+)
MHFAFLYDKRKIGCLETLKPGLKPIEPVSKWSSKSDLEVLGFFWLPTVPGQPDSGTDLAVVTNQGVEVFRLQFDQRIAKTQKNYPAAARICWLDPPSATALVCIGSRTLQPFDLRSKSPKLPRFDLVLNRGQSIEVSDVAVMTLYGSTFCIHCDGASGRVSLRNISIPTQGTPEHDIVIDVADDDTPLGALRLSQVDNLLVVHCIERMVSTVFDIRHKEASVVPALCGPSGIEFAAELGDDDEQREKEDQADIPAQTSWLGWDYLSGSTILDASCGIVYQLQVDVSAVLQEFLARSPHDLATVLKLLLRRTNCRDHVVKVLRKALASKMRSFELSQGFNVINGAYRQAIETMSSRISSTGPGRQATVSLNDLEAVICHQSIVSEKDMVAQVFHPHFIDMEGLDADELFQQNPNLQGNLDPDAALLEKWRIPLEARRKSDSCQGRCPFVLSALISYLRSLLSLQILPHKILQCFVFDLCLYFRHEHTLQQLLHYHVLIDSPDLVFRLRDLVVKGTPACKWATQTCLDMALRVRELTVVAEILLVSRQYLDIVPFLVNQGDVSFKIRQLLEHLEDDSDAKKADPELMDHVLSEIRLWHKEAAASVVAAEKAAENPAAKGKQDQGQSQAIPKLAPPDAEGCEKWLPELASSPSDDLSAILESTGDDEQPSS